MTLDESSVLIPGVPETRFARQIFWLGLHRRTIPGGSMLPTFHPEYFQPEAQLLAQVGRAPPRDRRGDPDSPAPGVEAERVPAAVEISMVNPPFTAHGGSSVCAGE
jgi:hypothetical protein